MRRSLRRGPDGTLPDDESVGVELWTQGVRVFRGRELTTPRHRLYRSAPAPLARRQRRAACRSDRKPQRGDAIGKGPHIGVSNFSSTLVPKAVRFSIARPVTNQFEYHPFLDQSVLIEATRRAGLAVTAYCGMAVGSVFSDPTLRQIAAAHGRSIAQVVLRWPSSSARWSRCPARPTRAASRRIWRCSISS